MKRAWAAVAMIAAVLILCMMGLNATNRMIGELSEEFEQAHSAVSQGNIDLAQQHSQSIVQLWDQNYRLLCTYIPHDKLEQIDQCIATLQSNLQYQEYAEFSAELNRAHAQLEHLRDTEMPSIENIL